MASRSWGGPRPGSGRPKGSGRQPAAKLRRNRVVVMVTDAELGKLRRLAQERDVAPGTAAYAIVSRALARQRGA